MDSLTRFKTAQDAAESGLDDALRELRAGRKRSHWIWYVFPQIAGLGSSAMTNYFGVQGRREAEAYLRDETLHSRLREAVDVVASHVLAEPSLPLAELMASEVDARKLVSSLTLFGAVAADLASRQSGAEFAALAEQIRRVLDVADREGYQRCPFTLQALTRDGGADT